MKKFPPLLIVPALGVLSALATPATRLGAQTVTETKIRLMAEVLRARDAGELEHAKETAGELQTIVPNDANVQRLRREIDGLIAARAETTKTSPSAAATGNDTTPAVEADLIAKAEAKRITGLLAQVPSQRRSAHRLADFGRYDEALAVLDGALAALPLNPLTQSAVIGLSDDRGAVVKRRDEAAAAAAAKAEAVAQKAAAESAKKAAVASVASHPEPGEPSPFEIERAETGRLAVKGRSQYLAGDIDGAQETFRAIETRDPDNAEAKKFLLRIAREKSDVGGLNREKTREQMIEEVTKSWQRPGIFHERRSDVESAAAESPLVRKLNDIVLPNVSFARIEIAQVAASLSAISEEFDTTGTTPKGVNVVLLDPANKAPTVTITLRNSSLKRVLDFVTEAIGYRYEVQADAVVLRPGGETTTLDTAFFPVTRATVLRMTSGGGAGPGTPGAVGGKNDPFSAAGAGREPAGVASGSPAGGEGPAMKAFLQQAGVNFEAVAGANLAYDGSALIVTQTARNLDRIRNILNRYNDVRQVEIEAKFMEVQQGVLDELGVNWNVATKATQRNAGAQATYATNGRTLADAFGSATTGQQGSIVRPVSATQAADGTVTVSDAINLPIVDNAPSLPGTSDLVATASPLAMITGVIGEFDVSAVVRALSQQQGTDLLSAPKVTVLSGNPANITVAQEMRYPQSFGQTQSQVGTGNSNGGGSAGVAITAGTPQEFTTRNVGVELKVTPTVEEDDYSISLDLNPRVTEFDGFVEYGGQSVAISGSTTVTVPSGFFQPIFSVRDISTKVTIWDGATLVMGGLTREEVKKVNDKVPILGDIPFLGRAFRSKGESSQKRNLLIFVTANLVSPGGSPKKQNLKSVPASSLFQNPTIVTPASAEPRTRSGK